MAKCSVRISRDIVIVSKVNDGNEVACLDLMPEPGKWLTEWAKRQGHQLVNVKDGQIMPLLPKVA